MRPFITAVKSNIKGGVDVSNLFQHTIVFGPNGSGKSKIINSIEYGVAGEMSDFQHRRQVKRDVKHFTEADKPEVSLSWSRASLSGAYSLPYQRFSEIILRGPIEAWCQLLTMSPKSQVHEELSRWRKIRDAMTLLSSEEPEQIYTKNLLQCRERIEALEEKSSRVDGKFKKELFTLARGVSQDIAKTATGFVPDSMGQVYIDCGTEESIQFRIGLIPKYHSLPRFALSGAEYTIVHTAISIALSQPDYPDSPMIVIPEDRAFDQVMLTRWMEKLEQTDMQVVIATASAVPHRDLMRVIKNHWRVIEL